jgi:hypothetical protein
MADDATLLGDHVTLTCRSVDRIVLQAYVPKLQSVDGLCQFLHWQKAFGIPSSAAFGRIGENLIFARSRQVSYPRPDLVGRQGTCTLDPGCGAEPRNPFDAESASVWTSSTNGIHGSALPTSRSSRSPSTTSRSTRARLARYTVTGCPHGPRCTRVASSRTRRPRSPDDRAGSASGRINEYPYSAISRARSPVTSSAESTSTTVHRFP